MAEKKLDLLARVDAGLAIEAYRFVSDQESRYYLTGIRIEPCPIGGVLIVATNGHYLAAFYDEGGICNKPLIVRLDAPMQAELKNDGGGALGESTGELSILVDGSLRLSAGDGEDGRAILTQHECLIEGTYPDWRRVVPAFPKDVTEPASFNGEYIAKFAGLTRGGWVRILSTGDSAPAIVLMSDRPEVLGILMPGKHGIEAKAPAWLAVK